MKTSPLITEMKMYVNVADAALMACAGQDLEPEYAEQAKEVRAKADSYKAIIKAYESSKR